MDSPLYAIAWQKELVLAKQHPVQAKLVNNLSAEDLAIFWQLHLASKNPFGLEFATIILQAASEQPVFIQLILSQQSQETNKTKKKLQQAMLFLSKGVKLSSFHAVSFQGASGVKWQLERGLVDLTTLPLNNYRNNSQVTSAVELISAKVKEEQIIHDESLLTEENKHNQTLNSCFVQEGIPFKAKVLYLSEDKKQAWLAIKAQQYINNNEESYTTALLKLSDCFIGQANQVQSIDQFVKPGQEIIVRFKHLPYQDKLGRVELATKYQKVNTLWQEQKEYFSPQAKEFLRSLVLQKTKEWTANNWQQLNQLNLKQFFIKLWGIDKYEQLYYLSSSSILFVDHLQTYILWESYFGNLQLPIKESLLPLPKLTLLQSQVLQELNNILGNPYPNFYPEYLSLLGSQGILKQILNDIFGNTYDSSNKDLQRVLLDKEARLNKLQEEKLSILQYNLRAALQLLSSTTSLDINLILTALTDYLDYLERQERVSKIDLKSISIPKIKLGNSNQLQTQVNKKWINNLEGTEYFDVAGIGYKITYSPTATLIDVNSAYSNHNSLLAAIKQHRFLALPINAQLLNNLIKHKSSGLNLYVNACAVLEISSLLNLQKNSGAILIDLLPLNKDEQVIFSRLIEQLNRLQNLGAIKQTTVPYLSYLTANSVLELQRERISTFIGHSLEDLNCLENYYSSLLLTCIGERELLDNNLKTGVGVLNNVAVRNSEFLYTWLYEQNKIITNLVYLLQELDSNTIAKLICNAVQSANNIETTDLENIQLRNLLELKLKELFPVQINII